MAARFAAERGVPPTLLMQMRRCVAQLDEVMKGFGLTTDQTDYARLNDEFHEILLECAQSTMIKRSLERVKSLPFAAPNAFVKSSRSELPGVRTILIVAQEQHRSILEAFESREGARAQAPAIEHSRSASKYLRLALDAKEPLNQVPGINLIRRRSAG